jgi:hypothetical protein
MSYSIHSDHLYISKRQGRFRYPTTHLKYDLKASSLISLILRYSPSFHAFGTRLRDSWFMSWRFRQLVSGLSAHMYCIGRSPHTRASAGFTARICAVAVPIPHLPTKSFPVRTVQHIVHFGYESTRRCVDPEAFISRHYTHFLRTPRWSRRTL